MKPETDRIASKSTPEPVRVDSTDEPVRYTIGPALGRKENHTPEVDVIRDQVRARKQRMHVTIGPDPKHVELNANDPDVGRAFNAIGSLGLGLIFSERIDFARAIVICARARVDGARKTPPPASEDATPRPPREDPMLRDIREFNARDGVAMGPNARRPVILAHFRGFAQRARDRAHVKLSSGTEGSSAERDHWIACSDFADAFADYLES